MKHTFYTNEEVTAFAENCKTAKKILVLTHANPDGDAIGSSVALYLGLKQLGYDVDLADKDLIDSKFAFIPATANFVTDFHVQDYQMICFTDCGDHRMTRLHEQKPDLIAEKDGITRVNIDHHASNDSFGTLNFVATDSSSTCELLAAILTDLGVKITPEIATALLLGIYTDTGGFMHQNTKPNTYLTASKLLEAGGDARKVADNIFHDYDLKTLKLWSKVLQNLHITPEGAAIVGVSKQDYESLGAERKDLEGIIDSINALEEAQYSVLLSEDNEGNVKASLRTRKEDVDVQALAKQYGGGGHIKAAGFTIPGGHLRKEVKWKIVTSD